ncbi:MULTISPECIES: sugar ABC transporter permease [Streptomyces]|uniref:Xylose transport system permease protein XylH n=1 Tax=Streptomyces venezuelae (strain ATCC 10712 / CBS 650.69 / DSM 40230 / JCM 4526 / NBRC 13096 / PD 04745) TaxID=953739 RepID=F2RKL5_STRVP|nr:ABC transporter permease [Streptomyces venezuelae]APE25701.1 ABC transporter permease [Streptomyces venezuelae]QES03038.1 sugar ABC transporter permease [Streptomyces venezuelae ATCC 10712]CCA60371.1 putative ABC transporter permease protein [Streptomyces venezuelae ATCC 10712]
MKRDRGRGPSPADDTASQEPAPGAVPAVDARLLVREEGVKGYVDEFRRKMRSGELGSLPVVLAVIIIWTVFGSLNSTFLSAQNLSDLSQQIVGTGMIAVGIVFVLLLGEIDLSVGSVSGLCAAIFAVLNVLNGMNEWLALLVAIAGGAAVGLIHGFFFAKVGVPAFVVTLAGNLAWNGLMLQVLGTSGTVNIPGESIVSKLYSTIYHSPAAAYVTAAVGVGLFLAASLLDAQRRRAARVPFRPVGEIVLRTVVIAALAFAAAYILNQYQGLPLALLIFLILLVLLDFVLRRTTYGRRIFAVGGNIEGARRAGISVAFVRMSVFSIAGTMAAIGGIFLAGQIQSASQTSGGGNLLMNVIAAAVIGGTSLFGGRGSVWSALLGALVIGSIQSGMNIMGVSNAVQFMITGSVLLAAVVVDSLSRRTQKAAGRA